MLATALPLAPAQAQRTDDNATAAAEDAFGKSVGDTAIGIYSDTDVRGFSPAEAANLRIEGLYYDQQGTLTDRTLAGSTIRVGISAQNYAFPAPTGIADYSLRKPGAAAITSLALTHGPRGATFVDADAKLPLMGETLGVAFGAGFDRDRRPFGGTPEVWSAGALVRYAPAPSAELIGFASHYRYTDGEAQPLIFSAGAYLPKRIPRTQFLGQRWNDYAVSGPALGALGRIELAGFEWRLGVFRSVFDNDRTSADLLFGTDRDGRVAQRVVVRGRDDYAASTSGELRASRAMTQGPRQHLLIASLRARDVVRRYGGAALVDLGPSRSDVPDPRPAPAIGDGAKTIDDIKQRNFGLAYQGKWLGVGEVGVSLQKSWYRKVVDSADPAIVFPATEDRPWLPSVTAAAYLSDRIALYGGWTRGLEESAAAPVEAVNRNEAPPAIRTQQVDGGVRWTIAPGVTAIAGVFRISKPYFNLDPTGRFRQLGSVTNQGMEFSLAGKVAPGLSLVVGNVLLDAEITGEEVANGAIGKRPIGSFVRRTLASIDYRLPWHEALSLDAVIDSSSARTADAANSFTAPARTTANLGFRYRLNVGGARTLVRGQVSNVGNVYGWNVGRSGFFTPIAARGYSLSLVADL